jgi:hypothetical protein
MIRRLKEASRNPFHGRTCIVAKDAQRRRLDRGEQVEFDIDAEVGIMLKAASQGSSITWADETQDKPKQPKRRRKR